MASAIMGCKLRQWIRLSVGLVPSTMVYVSDTHRCYYLCVCPYRRVKNFFVQHTEDRN